MERIEIMGFEELLESEDLPTVPKLVQKYLDLEEKNAKGKFFRVEIKEQSNSRTGAGIAYSNELRVLKKTDKTWKKVYSTGMMQYRGAYNYEIDNWDLSLSYPAILSESKAKVVYGLKTGIGNIKIYEFTDELKILEVFNTHDYKATKEKIELLSKILEDPDAFKAYVENDLERHWHIQDKAKLEDGNVLLFLAGHADRDYDAIDDYYQFYIWICGKGIGISDTYRTGAVHPYGKFYRYVVFFDEARVTARKKTGFQITAKVRERDWSERLVLDIKF